MLTLCHTAPFQGKKMLSLIDLNAVKYNRPIFFFLRSDQLKEKPTHPKTRFSTSTLDPNDDQHLRNVCFCFYIPMDMFIRNDDNLSVGCRAFIKMRFVNLVFLLVR